MCKKGEDEGRKVPYLITLFSAPNYCGWYKLLSCPFLFASHTLPPSSLPSLSPRITHPHAHISSSFLSEERYENQGAVLIITDNELSYDQFGELPQPFYVLPKNLNGTFAASVLSLIPREGISYSLPFVTEKLASFIGAFFGVLLDTVPTFISPRLFIYFSGG